MFGDICVRRSTLYLLCPKQADHAAAVGPQPLAAKDIYAASEATELASSRQLLMSGVVEEREPTKHIADGCRAANEDSEARELLATNGDTIGVVLTAMLAENDISDAMFRDDPRGGSGIWQS